MNLALLDPFGRAIPDRIDATLQIPATTHDVASCHALAYNRRGTYLATGLSNGTVVVHHVVSRTLAAVYEEAGSSSSGTTSTNPIHFLSWSRRSRTLAAGSIGSTIVTLIDTTHPGGPELASRWVAAESSRQRSNSNNDPTAAAATTTDTETNYYPLVTHSLELTAGTSFRDEPSESSTKNVSNTSRHVPLQQQEQDATTTTTIKNLRYPRLLLHCPAPIGSNLQLNPYASDVDTGGLIVLEDGTLVLFYVDPALWNSSSTASTTTRFHTIATDITYATFGPEHTIFAVTSTTGTLVGYNIQDAWNRITTNPSPEALQQEPLEPCFTVLISNTNSNSSIHLQVTSAWLVAHAPGDAMIRLYRTVDVLNTTNTTSCSSKNKTKTTTFKPTHIFQDAIHKKKTHFVATALTVEHIVAGANGTDFRYRLYIWNTSTGQLLEQLTGPSVTLYSISWHPARLSWMAVATSDGVIDVWSGAGGANKSGSSWVAAAPELFQALSANVEYVEGEDELDEVVAEVNNKNNNNHEEENGETTTTSNEAPSQQQQDPIDVMTLEPVPVFASDSEDEGEVFEFDVKVVRSFGQQRNRGRLED